MEDKYAELKASIPTITGRLLYEISWEGNPSKSYREGGRGRENVLTAEAMQILDFLPRTEFLGEVVAAMHGATEARHQLIADIEEADLQVLPRQIPLAPSAKTRKATAIVQPDGHLNSESVYCFLEAKRIRSSSFQTHQLAREVVATIKEARDRRPLLALILGHEPPVKVKDYGTMTIEEAVEVRLQHVIDNEVEGFGLSIGRVRDMLPEMLCWTTWAEIGDVVARQAESFDGGSESATESARRMAGNLATVLDWHS